MIVALSGRFSYLYARHTVRDTARMTGISLSKVYYCLKNILNTRKISARWMPHLLRELK